MRIIHLSSFDINGGGSRAAYRIHRSLLNKGLNSRMWVNKASSDDWTVKKPISKIEKVLQELRPRFINHTLCKMLRTQNDSIHSPSVFSSKWVKRINSSDADIVHLHWIQNEMLSIKDISKIKKPIVWTLHDMWAFCGAEHYTDDNRWREGYYSNNRPYYESGFDLNRWTWQRKKKYWNNPIQIVTSSLWLANCVSESALMHNWRVSVIPYPIDTDRWKLLDKKISRDQLGLPQNVPLILFGAIGGGKDKRKGFDLLLTALEHLKFDKNFKELELVVFGQSQPKSQPKLGFPIHYTGHLHDDISLQILYSAADAMIVPSRLEAFGQTASEAQVCGTPVISFNIGGLPDIIDHKKTGYLAKAFDTKDLANGISWVLDQSNNKHLKNNIRDQAVKKFAEKKISQDYLNIYENLLKLS
jgi:glycosyltransferase involved in cell wall biosynthesis